MAKYQRLSKRTSSLYDKIYGSGVLESVTPAEPESVQELEEARGGSKNLYQKIYGSKKTNEEVTSDDQQYGTPDDWEVIDSAETRNDDEEWTTVTWYKNKHTGKHVFVIGDSDEYNPWSGYENDSATTQEGAEDIWELYVDDPWYNRPDDDYDDEF